MFDYQLIRSDRRKTISLQVKRGRIVVRAPSFLSQQQIDLIITKKSAWLKRKLNDTMQLPATDEDFFVNGSSIWVNGQQKTLRIVFGKKAAIDVLNDDLLVTLSQRIEAKCLEQAYLSQQVKKYLAIWLKEQAQHYISKRLPHLSSHIDLIPISFKVRLYKARWGSCNNRGELSFNYLLMMTPLWVIDYVIIHELCHLKHLNHSTEFWQLVHQHCSNYKEAKSWLKHHQAQLVW
ncbi:MAG: putative metal-dependent hydrolase [Alteromonadaceae bacterium]|jgi:predicted metal-dependent hydrolase